MLPPSNGKYFICLFLISFGLLGRGQQINIPKTTKAMEDIMSKFAQTIDINEIKKNFRRFSERPRLSTSPGGRNLESIISNTWKSYGFEVEEPEYEVLMSFPQEDKPNKVSIINNDTKEVEYEAVGQVNVRSFLGGPKKFKYTPYLAYAPNGTVEGEPVYANGGSSTDLAELDKRNISLKGKIVIMKALFPEFAGAIKRGAIGAIVYPDPKKYAAEGQGLNDTYPVTPWLPPDALHRHTIIPGPGDPTTPLLPATCGMYKLPTKLREQLLPSQFISYEDAWHILSQMKGQKVNQSMGGGFNITYRFGPGFNTTNKKTTSVVRLEVNNQYVTKKIRNVIATIPGSEEPDRYVLFGSHRDAWLFGAADPISGTTVLMEISRILAKLMENGWRPRRTIKLCSWGAEEFGLHGSYEWSQENERMIRERAVAYLNTDVAVGGNFVLLAQSSPMLGDLVFKHAKQIQAPGNSKRTLFDTMLERLPRSKDNPGEPNIYKIKFLSDNYALTYLTGLTAADFNYFFGHKNNLTLYPVYHSQYDTFDWVTKFADPNFFFFKTITQFLGRMLIDLTDSAILPFSVPRFARSVQNAFITLTNATYTKQLDQAQLFYLEQALNEFLNMTKKFESEKKRLQINSSPLILRMFNDQMSGLEKMFFSPHTKRGILEDLKSSFVPTDQKLLTHTGFSNINAVTKMQNITQDQKNERLKFEMSLLIHSVRIATKSIIPLG